MTTPGTRPDWGLRIRADFPVLTRQVHGKPLVYLDSANTSQKPQAVVRAMDEFYRERNANVSRRAHAGQRSHRGLRGRARQARGFHQRAGRRAGAHVGHHVRHQPGGLQLGHVAAQGRRHDPGDADGAPRQHRALQLVAERTGATIKVVGITPTGELAT